MPHDRIEAALAAELNEQSEAGTRKGRETVIAGVIPASGGKGPRCRLVGEGDRDFLRMNSNSYLGLGRHPEVIAAEEAAVRACGTGPGAVRFIIVPFGFGLPRYQAQSRTLVRLATKDAGSPRPPSRRGRGFRSRLLLVPFTPSWRPSCPASGTARR